jgi:predicted DNA-binding protein with PD1-like motif
MAGYEALGKQGRVLAIRLASGTDVLEGIVEACKKHDIRSAVIQGIIGGVNKAHVEVAKPSDASPVGVEAKAIHLDKPHAILSGQGMVCINDQRELEVHMHIVFVDEDGRAVGGHLESGSAPVTTTADVIISEVLDVEFGRGFDEEVGTVLFFPRQL